MTEKKLDQQANDVGGQTRPRTDGAKVSTLPRDSSLDETALDQVSGGILTTPPTHMTFVPGG